MLGFFGLEDTILCQELCTSGDTAVFIKIESRLEMPKYYFETTSLAPNKINSIFTLLIDFQRIFLV